MDPLENLLRPIARFLNKNIEESTPARELCEKLDGKVIAVRVRDTALAMYFTIYDREVVLSTDSDADPDVVITGSLLTLASLATSAEAAGNQVRLDLTGDLESAQRFQRLLRFARPDVEEQLSAVVGDAAAHQIGEAARSVARWGAEVRDTMQSNVREYLQEERRDLPSRYEAERLAGDIDSLRDDVERLAVRIDRLLAKSR